MSLNRRSEGQLAVLADANVLFSQEQRNVLMTMALEGLFRLHWTEAIEDEWVRNRAKYLSKAGKDTSAPVRTAEKMRTAIPDFSPGDWRALIGQTGATHPKDRHAAAAAMACAPSHLLTWNMGDFDVEHLRRQKVFVVTPDEFLCDLYDEIPDITYEASRRAHGYARAGAGHVSTWASYLERLAGSGLPLFSTRLRADDRDHDADDLPELHSTQDDML